MTESYIMMLAQNAMSVTLMLAAPALVVSLVIGSVISLIQAATQINEVTLTFIPKLIGIILVLAFLGSWMLQQMLLFTSTLINSLPNFVR